METGFTDTSEGCIFWRRWGSGQHLLICLHGFADTGQSFAPLADALPADFCLIAPDLPRHGQSNWPSPHFYPVHVKEILLGLLQATGRPTAYVLGHSWGGRLLMNALPLMAEYASSAWFIAPGGFEAGARWNSAHLPRFVRKGMLQSLEKQRDLWLNLAKKLQHAGVVSASAYRMFEANMETPRRRERLIWVYRNLVHFPVKTQLLASVSIPLFFAVGDRDSIVPLKAVQRFSNQLPQAQFIALKDCNHWPLGRELAAVVAREVLKL